ncbi:hypothetical protein [Microlunatus sp. Gsoil 973]|uniref:hypothetical protein n=1 Tax=Microlunatus sp. Gsoil 973 TaxID=2672569 RepID=UPI0012B503A7|nr:hypothetical protein [Microlunatus sp. Gsoil 973]QGN32940.1 hypothetical protein GJV80_09095 [Microlunatus sp. Gsoil 973]
MLDPETADALLLPPRTRLLHIGPMKTGTTSLQLAAHRRREVLLANGVRYPGTAPNHRRPLGALMEWSVNTWNRARPLGPDRLDVDRTGIPAREEWERLKEEIDAEIERRIFITHEFVSQVDDATAQRIIDAIGDPTHVCITLRAPGRIVPSLWAQSVRDDAQTEPFESWLGRYFGKDSEHPLPERHRRAYDQGQLVSRWASLIGPENVTVIVVDRSDPDLLASAVEAMLGLPHETLSWKRSNDSLTATDAELFRHVNVILRDRKATWSTFHNLVWQGAIKLGPEQRSVSPNEPRVLLPPWAAEIADRDGARFAEHIRGTAVRVVGDLDNLAVKSPTAPWRSIEEIPVNIAAEAVAGAVLAGQRARRDARKELDKQAAELEQLQTELAELTAERDQLVERERSAASSLALSSAAAERAERPAAMFGAHQLAAGLKRRLLRRVRTHRSHPLDKAR